MVIIAFFVKAQAHYLHLLVDNALFFALGFTKQSVQAHFTPAPAALGFSSAVFVLLTVAASEGFANTSFC